MASLSYRTRNPGSKKGSARVLPAALRNDQEYLKAYDERVLAHHDFYNAVGALNSARNQIKSHENYHKQSSDQHQGSLYTPLSDAALENLDKKIAEEKTIINEEHGKFAAAHEKMRDMEKGARVKTKHRLARTDMFGKMYGKHGIYNINASHIAEKDKMEPVLASAQYYLKKRGGRRKKTRKKRRRKNKRKTKRRKKTRRRKKRRKKRRTKRR